MTPQPRETVSAAQHTVPAVTALLVRATEEVLWPLYQDLVLSREPKATLQVRAGRGKATYHTVSFLNEHGQLCPRLHASNFQHVITYGLKMVHDKLESPATAARWLSGRELLQRGYFEGVCTPLNLFAHTVCHEFSHLLQHTEGGRVRGSVHNAQFYAVLDELHRNQSAFLIQRFLSKELKALGLRLTFRRPEHDLESRQSQMTAQRTLLKQSLAKGQRVRFVSGRGEEIKGWVKRLNQKTVTVIPEQPEHPGQYWRVSYALIERDDTSGV